jgi:methylthioribose-1-phosphate isomerase
MKMVVQLYPSTPVAKVKQLLKKKAFEIFETDGRVCRKMGAYGAKLIKNGDNVMTICNAGALATVDYGTALGVFYAAKEAKKKFKVFACETRPLLQGSRLTAWELMQNKIDTTLITDSMAAVAMRDKKIKAVFTGADRIAANGDSANKIGTYGLAVLAKHHNIPFYIVAPKSTFDLSLKSGKEIPIEERDGDEVRYFQGKQSAPKNVKVFNPAFDVTPNVLISGIVTEYGIISKPDLKKIRMILKD